MLKPIRLRAQQTSLSMPDILVYFCTGHSSRCLSRLVMSCAALMCRP